MGRDGPSKGLRLLREDNGGGRPKEDPWRHRDLLRSGELLLLRREPGRVGLGLNVYLTQLVFGGRGVALKLLVYYLSVFRHAGRRLTMARAAAGSALALGFRILVSPVSPAHSHRPRPLADNPPHPIPKP